MSEREVKALKRGEVVIVFNGKRTPLGDVLVNGAKRVAHQMVRKYLQQEAMREKEANAKVMVYGVCVDEICGFRKCGRGAITILHSDCPNALSAPIRL